MPNLSDIKKIEKKPAPQTEQPAPTQKEQTRPKTQTKQQKTLSWETPEYLYTKKSPDWYWSLGIITLALFGVAVWQQNFLFAIMIIIGSFAIVLYAVRYPRTIKIVISIRGVEIDSRLYPYETLKSFWIFYHPGGVKELSVLSEKVFMPRIMVPLGDTDPVELRELLIEFLPEKAHEESLTDTIARRLGF
jgi:hypothetical protein